MGLVRLFVAPGVNTLRRHGINYDIDSETGVVQPHKALVPEIIVPFATEVLVRVKHRDTPVYLDGLEVLVYQVVTPAI